MRQPLQGRRCLFVAVSSMSKLGVDGYASWPEIGVFSYTPGSCGEQLEAGNNLRSWQRRLYSCTVGVKMLYAKAGGINLENLGLPGAAAVAGACW